MRCWQNAETCHHFRRLRSHGGGILKSSLLLSSWKKRSFSGYKHGSRTMNVLAGDATRAINKTNGSRDKSIVPSVKISTALNFYYSTDSHQGNASGSTSGDAGLFSIPTLRQPSDFITMSNNAIKECNDLRDKLKLLTTRGGGISSTKQASDTLLMLDDVSKIVCDVIDAAELCRSVHSSAVWKESANNAFSIMSEYISLLNSDVYLYLALTDVISSSAFNELTYEERRFAFLLKSEFERDGIHLPDDKRDEVRRVQNSVVQLETLFSENITNSKKFFNVAGNESRSVDEVIPRHILEAHVPQQSNIADTTSLTLSCDAHISNALLRYSPNSQLRQEVYMATNTSCGENLEVLDALIQRRHEVSTLLGFESYADRFLRDKMAQNQQSVFKFLNTLHSHLDNSGQYKNDMNLLLETKKKVEGHLSATKIEPWDIQFYTGIIKAHNNKNVDINTLISPYLTLSNTLEAMTILVKKVFGITMVEDKDISLTERWDLDSTSGVDNENRIRKFIFTEDETERPLGTMYLDLHQREGKYSHAAHFTVRCGCSIGPVEDNAYQLPIVALVCNLSRSGGELSHGEVETLFHEFGHALHSLLSRTIFQHVSGTRGCMDFVETPSHLIEQYVWDPSFLNILTKHHITGETLPENLVHSLIKSRNDFRSIDIQNQILYSMFDQTIFGNPTSATATTTDIFAKLHKDRDVPYAEGTHWHTRFGHLVTYGAGYYGYLYSQVFAHDIWDTCILGVGNNALNRQSGERVWKEMLIHGGAKDPNHMLQTLLGREPKVDSFLQRMSMN